jgi:CheY-like chemotaxis protein
MTSRQGLSGLRILVVEDEPLIAMALEDILQAFGCEVVGPAFSLAEAQSLSREQSIDGAFLDVNVSGEKVFPVADILSSRHIPYCFVTGYGSEGLRTVDRNRPVLQKPYNPSRLIDIAQRWSNR